MSFWSSLASVTKSSQSGWLSRVLTGAGISVASYSANRFFLQGYIDDFVANTHSLGGFGASLIHMSGIDIFMQTILTAVMIAMAQNSSKLFLKSAKH